LSRPSTRRRCKQHFKLGLASRRGCPAQGRARRAWVVNKVSVHEQKPKLHPNFSKKKRRIDAKSL
jgi:hypothetical protein